MEEYEIKTKIFKDENFTIICKNIEESTFYECYLIYEPTKDIEYIGYYNETDLPKLDKIANNLLSYYEIDLLESIIKKRRIKNGIS